MTDARHSTLSYGFFGSGGFAARCLELLLEWRVPSWIVTAPASPAGRGKGLTPTPVESFARCSLPDVRIIRTSSASSDSAVLELKKNSPVSFCFVIDFGQMIKEPILAWREHIGCLNIHPSLLPRYRGAAPIQRALMDGAEATGVTIFKLASGMDCGPVMLSEKITINAEDDAGTLLERAAVLGASSFTKYAKTTLLEEWAFSPQDDLNATTADKIRGEEERIDWSKPASRIFGLARALNPKPGAWTTIRGRRLRVLKTMVIADVPSNLSKAPGELLGASGEGVLVATGEGALVLREVQMEGKKIQSAAEWWNGLRAAPEERLL